MNMQSNEEDYIGGQPDIPKPGVGEWNREAVEDELREQLHTLLRLTSAMQPKTDEEFIAVAIPNFSLWAYQFRQRAHEEGERYGRTAEAERCYLHEQTGRREEREAMKQALNRIVGYGKGNLIPRKAVIELLKSKDTNESI